MKSALKPVLCCLKAHPEGRQASQIWVELSQQGNNFRLEQIVKVLDHCLQTDRVCLVEVSSFKVYFLLQTSEG